METISIREAAERLGVSVKIIRRLVTQGALRAEKARGGHGEEWRVEAESVAAYRAAPTLALSPARPATPFPTVPSPTMPGPTVPSDTDALRQDKAFLQRQVETLTTLLGQALGSVPAGAPPSGPEPGPEPTSAVSPAAPAFVSGITAALQSSLRLVNAPEVVAVELCSVKLLWGRPVLWRLVAREPSDISALLEAILSPAAAWDPPGEEVVFLWTRDAGGEVLWGAACGPGWFGAPFEEVLRAARVERA